MFEFDELETVDPTLVEALFRIDGEVLSMQLPRSDLTPHDVCEIWEREWGVAYASRLRFEAPPDVPLKWLNQRTHHLPAAPSVVRLDGMGSILTAVATALRQRGGAPEAPPVPPADAIFRKKRDAPAAKPKARPKLGPGQRDEFKSFVNAITKRSGKFGQGQGHAPLFRHGVADEDERGALQGKTAGADAPASSRRLAEERWGQEDRWRLALQRSAEAAGVEGAEPPPSYARIGLGLDGAGG